MALPGMNRSETMPELPEVETVKKSLDKFLVGKKVKAVKVIYKPIVSNSSQTELNKFLIGKSFSKVDRIGKFLLIRIGEYTLVSHLRMEGKYYFGKYKNSVSKNKDLVEVDLNSEMLDQFHKHIHLIIELEDNSLLIYHDTRKFGRIHLFKTGEELSKPPLSNVGSEPFSIDNKAFFNGLQRRSIPLKQALLDQTLIAGLGNIYVDETLFLSKLNPFTPANKVTKDQSHKLVASAVTVLNKAINMGGSTIRSYHVDNEVSGKFQNELFVYGREGQVCKDCNTLIVKTFINGRGTHFCPQCQMLPIKILPRIIGVTGIINSGKTTVSNKFEKIGYLTINADDIVRKAYTDKKIISSIARFFGKSIIENQQINRLALRVAALSQPDGLLKLEKLVHPYVIKETKKILNENKTQKYVLDVPLLFESKMNELCDLVLFVSINDKAWRQRVIKSNKMPLKDAQLMKKRMIPNEFKIKNSNIIVENSGNLKELDLQINHLFRILKAIK
jgi:formamidopyrimidine-DNA glycosylase